MEHSKNRPSAIFAQFVHDGRKYPAAPQSFGDILCLEYRDAMVTLAGFVSFMPGFLDWLF
ncbi:MAG: hypothetical protein ACI3XJ_11300 [Oscillospiraceae bacterium]